MATKRTVQTTAKKSDASSKRPTMAKAKAKVQPVSTSTLHDDRPRRIRAPKRHVWRRQDRRFRARPKLPNVWRLTKQASGLLFGNWKVVGGIVLAYGLLTIIFVRGLNGGADVTQLKEQINTLFQGTFGHVAAGLSVLGLLVSSSNSASTNAAGPYQTFILLICSMALVWVFRQRMAGATVRIRDGFYGGMYPLVPTILVLMIIGLQLLPFGIGLWLYNILINGGVLISSLEKAAMVLILLVLAAISLYMICSSIFALYIVTLPGMTPLKALRSARELVRYRRWTIIRKLLYLPLLLMVVGGIIMLPCILFLAVAAQWLFFVLSMATLAAVHAYLYVLYRELIRE